MSDSRVKESAKEIVRMAGIHMLDSGITIATWGNVSYCDRETGLMYITPSGMDYHSLTNDDIVVFDLDGNHIEGERRPSIEHDLHRLVLRERTDVTAVIHTHPIFSTVFSSMGEDIPIDIHDESAQALGDTVKCCKYCLPGTREIAEEVAKNLSGKSNACLMKSHGAVCVGEDMDSAFKVSTVLEMVAEIYWRIRATGGTYVPIAPENVAAMQDFVKTKYGQY